MRKSMEQNETGGSIVGMNLTTLCLRLKIPIHLLQSLLVDRPKVRIPLSEALVVEDHDRKVARQGA